MLTLAEKRKALVFGVNDHFATGVVDGLVESGNRIFLCGRDNQYVRNLRESDSGHIAFFSDWDGPAWLKRTQSMLEWFGSVDTFIFFLDEDAASNGLRIPVQEGVASTGPVDITRSLVPYLNKISGCKMVFVNTDAFSPTRDCPRHDPAGFREMAGMCRSLSDDLKNANIDIRTLFTRPDLPPGRARGVQARHAMPVWNQRLVAWVDDSLQFGDILNPA